MNADDFLKLSDERGQWQQRIIEAGRRAYAAGYADGRRDYEREASTEWAQVVPLRVVTNPETLADIEARRWGPGGREHFADPRPGDYVPAAQKVA